MFKKQTFSIRSSAPPVIKVSFPSSSTVTAESFSKLTPAANGCPGLLQIETYASKQTNQAHEVETFIFTFQYPHI